MMRIFGIDIPLHDIRLNSELLAQNTLGGLMRNLTRVQVIMWEMGIRPVSQYFIPTHGDHFDLMPEIDGWRLPCRPLHPFCLDNPLEFSRGVFQLIVD